MYSVPCRNLFPGGYAELWRIAAPLILSMASYTIMQFCDRVFLSRYGSVMIQAALPGGVLAHTFTCFFQALAGYAGTFTAQYHGARSPEQSLRASVHGLWIALAAWPIILACIPVGIWLMHVSGHSAEVISVEKTYFTILMAGGVGTPFAAAVGGYFVGVGHTRVNLIANAIGCGINILLNYLMIFGKGGFPEMGIRGAAWATVISVFISFFILLVLFLRATRPYPARRIWCPEAAMFARIIRYGFSHGVSTLSSVGSFGTFILVTGGMGDVSLAASNIAFSINNLAFSPLSGFGMATSSLVSQHLGGRRFDAAQHAGYTGLKLGLFYMLLIGSTFVFLPREYYAFFRPASASFTQEQLLSLGRPMLRLMAIWGFFDTVSILFCSALKGAGDTRFVLCVEIFLSWLLLIPGALFIIRAGGGILSIWIWLSLVSFFFAFAFAWRWRRGSWKKIQMI